jgi:hypothetical protein
MSRRAIYGIPDHGQQVQRQQVHCVEQKDPDKNGQGERSNQLAACGIVHNAFCFAVHHFNENLNSGLKAPRNP